MDRTKQEVKAVMFYPILFIIKRMVFVFVVVFMTELLFFQIFLFLFITTVVLLFLIEKRPYEEEKMNRLDIMNEIVDVIVLFHVIVFSFGEKDSDNQIFGLTLIGVTIIAMSVHIITSLVEQVRGWKNWCREKFQKRQNKMVPEPKPVIQAELESVKEAPKKKPAKKKTKKKRKKENK